MILKKLAEGKISFFVPEGRVYDAPVFYNPDMTFNRNISVAALSVFSKNFGKAIEVCDAMAATGVRGLRYAKEVGTKSVINDKNPTAAKLIEKNIKLNKLEERCTVKNSDANVLLHQNTYTAIDIDPFGSPNIFLDSAARSIYRKGLLMVTATDTAPLCGTYPDACFRKYGIRSIKTDFYNELGIRILITNIVMAVAKREKLFTPLLSFAKRHYFRAIGKIEGFAGQKFEENFGYVMFCKSCGNRKTGEIELNCSCGRRFDFSGPMYLGQIQDKKFAADTAKECRKRGFEKEAELAELLKSESELPTFYYDLHFLSHITKKECPKTERLIENLRERGYKAGKTHFCPTAVKTDAGFEEITMLW